MQLRSGRVLLPPPRLKDIVSTHNILQVLEMMHVEMSQYGHVLKAYDALASLPSIQNQSFRDVMRIPSVRAWFASLKASHILEEHVNLLYACLVQLCTTFHVRIYAPMITKHSR